MGAAEVQDDGGKGDGGTDDEGQNEGSKNDGGLSPTAVVPIPSEQDSAWQAPPEETGVFTDLLCTNGSISNVMFKEGEYHAMCIHNGAEMISTAIKATGKWEGDLCAKMQHYERIGKSFDRAGSKFWFVDVGANIGFLSLCGYQVLPTVSIEAAPWNFDMLDQTRQHWQSRWNDRPWYTVHQAVSTVAGHTVKLLGSIQNYGGTNLVDPANHPLHLSHGWGEGSDIRYGSVITNTLDQILKTRIPKDDCIAVMKVDIEGYEYFGMQSFEEGLRTRPPCNIFMEYHTILLKAASSKNRDDPSALKLVAILQAAGYVGDHVLPQDPSTEVEVNIHWQMKHPKETSSCDCQSLTVPYPR